MLKLPLPLRFTLKARVIPGRVILTALLGALLLLAAIELARVGADAQSQPSPLPPLVGETPAAVTVILTDAQGGVHNLPAEDVRPVPGGLGFAQVTFRLPNNLAAGSCQVKLVAHNLTSNVGAIRIIQ